MHLNNVRLVFLSMIAAAATCSAAVVDQVCVRQMWPWHEKVRIDYTLTGEIGEVSDISVKVRDVTGNELKPLGSSFSGDLLEVLPGERVIWWNPAEAGIEIGNTQLTFTLEAVSDPQRYCVIDIATPDEYTVSYLAAPPAGGWTDDYLETKIVLKHIRPGVFMMGSPADEKGRVTSVDVNVLAESYRQVTLSKDFYIGVFPLTHAQVINLDSEAGVPVKWMKPHMAQMGLSFKSLMGMSGDDSAWKSAPIPLEGSLLYKMNARIVSGQLPEGFHLSLPTEAQWEYACRAGTSSAYNDGSQCSCAFNEDVHDPALDRLAAYIRYNNGNLQNNGYSIAVNGLRPNAWGLYAFHGFVREWVLDGNSGVLPDTPVVDPFVPTTWWPGMRGGSYSQRASQCRSASRYYRPNEQTDWANGGRIALIKNW